MKRFFLLVFPLCFYCVINAQPHYTVSFRLSFPNAYHSFFTNNPGIAYIKQEYLQNEMIQQYIYYINNILKKPTGEQEQMLRSTKNPAAELEYITMLAGVKKENTKTRLTQFLYKDSTVYQFHFDCYTDEETIAYKEKRGAKKSDDYFFEVKKLEKILSKKYDRLPKIPVADSTLRFKGRLDSLGHLEELDLDFLYGRKSSFSEFIKTELTNPALRWAPVKTKLPRAKGYFQVFVQLNKNGTIKLLPSCRLLTIAAK